MTPTFPHKESHLALKSAVGLLEAHTTWPAKAPQGVAIVCHPHPLHGGTMSNKVVTTLAKAFDQLNLATVRFNFRGVGKSEGEHDHARGECDDLIAVMNWVEDTLPELPIWLAGFSFGSFIAANVANQKKVAQLISIAPPVNHYDFKLLTNIQCPWFVVQGDLDEIVSAAEVEVFAEHPPSPLTFVLMPNTSHFFHGQLLELREIVVGHYLA